MGTGDRRQRDRLQRRRGVSMVLVLMAMTIALILGMSFLHAQIVATGMAETVTRQAGARALAESGLAIALAHIDTNPDWRSTCSQGTWIDEHELAGGTVTVTGEDGQDTDGDGLVDGDGDLADDDADPITLTAVGTVDEVTHRIRAVVTPRPSPQRLLLVVPNSGFLSLNDRRRYTQFATWGYEVTCIDESEGQNAFDAAVADADVAYISETVYSATLNTKLRDAPIGIVIEAVSYTHLTLPTN